MHEDNRTALTGGLWFVSSLALCALFISAAAQSELTAGHIILAGIILTLALSGTIYLLHLEPADANREKAKREGIHNLLRDMSDDDLAELRQRLKEDQDAPEPLLELSPHDGELIRRD